MGIFARAAAALVFLTGMGLATATSAQKADVKNSSDHPAVGRYEGAVITFHETKGYEETRLPFKPLEKGDGDNPSAWQIDLAGKLTSIRYEGPGDRSALEIMRNYEAALKAGGFEIRFFCRGKEQCAPAASVPTFWNAGRGASGLPTTWDTTIYLLAERTDAAGAVTIGMLAVETKPGGNRPLLSHVAVTIVEGQPMETDKITLVEASEIEQALARDGRIAIYGIYFDFDQADIKPESQPQIDQLGALLKDNPALQVIVVGHTDGKGAFDYNLSLSQRRAQAVADALVSGYAVERARVVPAGAGMVSPVASNRTEDGRAKNRRVEIVELYTGG